MYLKLLMDKFYIETLSEIETAINELEIEADYSIQRIEVIISLILKHSSYLDYKYFTRGNHEIKLGLDAFYFEADHNSSTSHDFKVAKIMANDLIQIYLENELKLVNKLSPANNLLPEIRWTASKTALTELIYALYSQGSFDNGNIDIKIIAKAFEFFI